TLVHVQGNIRVFFNKTLNNRRQRIAGLSVGGGDAQVTLALITEFLGNLLDALYPAQNLPGFTNDDFATRGDASQVLPASGKDLQPQLILKQADLLGYAGLRREKALSSGGHVQIMVRNFPDITQLL